MTKGGERGFGRHVFKDDGRFRVRDVDGAFRRVGARFARGCSAHALLLRLRLRGERGGEQHERQAERDGLQRTRGAASRENFMKHQFSFLHN
jgi:hypothetical protein